MRRGGRFLLLGVLLAAACVDKTFDMLPAAPDKSTGGSDTAGAPAAGRGAAGRAAAGRGGSGRGGTGGAGAQGGKGAGGSGGGGGTGAVSEGGAGNEPPCGFPGCDSHCKYGGPGCIDCRSDADCAAFRGQTHCSEYSGCVECRPAETPECPDTGVCDADCPSNESCDEYTYTCQIDCKEGRHCPGTRPFCDQAQLCRQCDPTPANQVWCTDGLACSPLGECHPCGKDNDCNYPNPQNGVLRDCIQGRCVTPTPVPP